MRKSRWLLVLVGLLVIAGLWFFFGHRSATGPANASPAAGQAAHGRGRHGGMAGTGPVPVVVGKVEKKDVPIYLNGIGTVQAYNTVTITPQVSGILTNIDFQEGQDVVKGDLLAVIDPRTFQAQYDQAVAKKAEDVAQLNNNKVLLDRDTDLFKKGVLDHQTYDTQRYLVDQLDATVKADQASIDSAQTQLSYTRIRAPFDGRCGIRMVDQGNVVSAASALLVITQLKPISVIFTLPQQNVQEVNEAAAKGPLKVVAVNSGETKVIEEGTLAVVNNQIDVTTGTVKLKANFPNQDLKLWPGQFVNARLLVTTQKDALVVPSAVVQRGPNGAFAYTVNDQNVAEMRPITVGQVDANQAIIKSGLAAGDTVIVDGQYKVQPGSKVQATAENPTQNGESLTSAGSSSGNAPVDPPPGGSPAGRTFKGNGGHHRHRPESASPSASPSPSAPSKTGAAG